MGMEPRAATMIGVATFVIGVAVAALIFAALDVEWVFLLGPVAGIGLAAYAAYRTALRTGR